MKVKGKVERVGGRIYSRPLLLAVYSAAGAPGAQDLQSPRARNRREKTTSGIAARTEQIAAAKQRQQTARPKFAKADIEKLSRHATRSNLSRSVRIGGKISLLLLGETLYV